MSVRYDITVRQGETYRLTIPVQTEGGSPITLTGYSVAGQVRETHASATVLHDLAPTADGSNVVIDIPAGTSAGWSWRYGVYDIELTAPDSKVTRLLEGSVTVSPEVTR